MGIISFFRSLTLEYLLEITGQKIKLSLRRSFARRTSWNNWAGFIRSRKRFANVHQSRVSCTYNSKRVFQYLHTIPTAYNFPLGYYSKCRSCCEIRPRKCCLDTSVRLSMIPEYQTVEQKFVRIMDKYDEKYTMLIIEAISLREHDVAIFAIESDSTKSYENKYGKEATVSLVNNNRNHLPIPK